MAKRSFGSLRKLPSGRWQARYRGPDGQDYTARTEDGSALTFTTRTDAAGWLSRTDADIQRGVWVPPATTPAPATDGPLTFGAYAERWLAERMGPGGRPLATRTRDLYASVYRVHIAPAFAETPLADITSAEVRSWYATAAGGAPRARANAYGLLRTVMGTAAADGLIPANPCTLRGAGSYRRAKEPATATLAEVATIRAALPGQYRSALDLGLWCSLRIGEVIGLQRDDIDLQAAVVHVRRAVGRTRAGLEVGLPKSRAGTRTVTVPANMLPDLAAHLATFAAPGRTGWMFPSSSDPARPLLPDVLREAFEAARAKAGREDLTFHALRGVGATLAARCGATVRELQDRLGHTTPNMALAYQRVAAERPREIAARLAELAAGESGNVTPITTAKGGDRKPRVRRAQG